ncbi:type II toxin-antitoxin system RelE/ParE family toxin [Cupriavidus pauculus]|uniref:Type II toxin-antitoxin system RelE/ParE family toxin n=1 Tax=Cupriavidus pauculus TaxID=82633 RepID=A0A2N5CI55_9BURK|nr:type II toxin-antitoxin system RelE/ParE family toxin [Cupriavidus pauculus]PLQ01892.1 hypothetical protein CYJ10_00865 [Cupriavidus pauculus]
MIATPNYKRPFRDFVKKAGRPLQKVIEDEVELVCDAPATGEPKAGDLAGIRVHKFRFHRQEYLMAYRGPSPEQAAEGIDIELVMIDFYQVGPHENFYDLLKRYLRAERNA